MISVNDIYIRIKDDMPETKAMLNPYNGYLSANKAYKVYFVFDQHTVLNYAIYDKWGRLVPVECSRTVRVKNDLIGRDFSDGSYGILPENPPVAEIEEDEEDEVVDVDPFIHETPVYNETEVKRRGRPRTVNVV